MKHLFLGASLLMFSLNSFAQPGSKMTTKKKGPSTATYFDVNLNMGIPMEDFANTTSSLPFGFTMNVLYQPNTRAPFQFGGGLAFLSAGSRTINKNLTADILLGTTVIDQLVIPLEFKIRNNIVNGHAMIRIQPSFGAVRPYLDIVGGFNYFWTNTSLYDRSDQNYFTTDDKNRIFSKSQASDITWSAGGGVGLMARLNEQMFLNFSATYMFGGQVDYYDKDQIAAWDIELNTSVVPSNVESVSLQGNDVNINALPKRSKTDMLMAQIGITFPMNSAPKKTLPRKTFSR
jgi:hypothetical protein